MVLCFFFFQNMVLVPFQPFRGFFQNMVLVLFRFFSLQDVVLVLFSSLLGFPEYGARAGARLCLLPPEGLPPPALWTILHFVPLLAAADIIFIIIDVIIIIVIIFVIIIITFIIIIIMGRLAHEQSSMLGHFLVAADWPRMAS